MNLLDYAKANRLRTRNLHDGQPCPPAYHRPFRGKPHPDRVGYVGGADRCDAIVGAVGYIDDIGLGDKLGITLFRHSARGAFEATKKLVGIGGKVLQTGDIELSGSFPASQIEIALKLIRVSRLPPGNPNIGTLGNSPGTGVGSGPTSDDRHPGAANAP